MDVLEEVTRLLEAKQGSENSVARRVAHIKWLWLFVATIMTTGFGCVVSVTLWVSRIESTSQRTVRAVELMYKSYFGHELP